jgi:hypothetical protein
MTRDEIIEMANKAGMDYLQYLGPEAFEKVVVFSKLVAQHEREACAKVCDVLAYHPEFASDATKLAAMAIRARGQA